MTDLILFAKLSMTDAHGLMIFEGIGLQGDLFIRHELGKGFAGAPITTKEAGAVIYESTSGWVIGFTEDGLKGLSGSHAVLLLHGFYISCSCKDIDASEEISIAFIGVHGFRDVEDIHVPKLIRDQRNHVAKRRLLLSLLGLLGYYVLG